MSPDYRAAATWIEQAIGCLAEAVECMPDDHFLAEHAAAHEAPRSPSVDPAASVLEREGWRRDRLTYYYKDGTAASVLRLAPKRNVGERHSDGFDGSSGLTHAW
ncbi:MAG: hypothetical protein EOQ69_25315 [Mesorhizobium sp.]|uniref:hypothetical protein n=1 Tax=Mesorhizobium sp. TaxID=1871066 RepID=UPI000FE33B0B|nr:hypothetical protein [Mesorhizobium sp.]RWG78797.1 MAG: hypothetical protein EOQ69_25315 [Mesorhizobium sp.]RWK18579.1 MAG: hypothetical protein EOR43_25460 [Mesorhizobium sp.]RWK27853.1 MAG: hypothetical protein EOR44_25370 [Mesorhizobium sp.]